MKTYDVICPICGGMNRRVDLEETEGFMECEACFTIVQVPKIRKTCGSWFMSGIAILWNTQTVA